MAFDFLTPEGVSTSFIQRDVHGTLAAAFFRESLELMMQALFPQTSSEKEILYTRCEKTGATDTTLKWNAVIEYIFAHLRPVLVDK